VLVVAKTHLDVGFTDLAAVVRERYLREYFPRAVRVAAELRARGDGARLRWTTGSWILHEALEDEARRGGHDIERAVEAGDLCWHALPFTLHTEYCDRSLFEHGLTLSARLDDRFGHRTRAAKVTDVPGHTRGIVSALAGVGVSFLHVGVNPATTPPDVPRLFRWRDPSASVDPGTVAPELVVMYQPGSYGDVQFLPGTDVAIAVDLTGDNLGPRQTDDVLARWASLAARFPDAELVAASFDDVADEVGAIAAQLPVVTAEIGDTWLHGVGSDPVKTAAYRALCRQRRTWIDGGRASADEPALWAASTELLLVAEHTWGMDLKTHWPDQDHWSVEQLASVRDDPATVRFESSWREQRAYLDRSVDTLRALGRADLADEAEAARASVRPEPSRAPLEPAGLVSVELPGGGELTIGDDGAIRHLVDPDGRVLADASHPLGALRVQTFDADDLERRYVRYNAVTADEDQWWARWDNTKPGLERAGSTSGDRSPSSRGTTLGSLDGALVVHTELGFPAEAEDAVDTDDADGAGAPALPERLVQTVVVRANAAGQLEIELDLAWFGLPAARWPVAWWWQFAPIVADAEGWSMQVFDELVDPFDVVVHGGRHLHCADRLLHRGAGIEVDLVDTALVSPGRGELIDVLDRPVELTEGWSVLAQNNLWGTNFPMWVEGDGRVRVLLQVSTGRVA
jgi:hypothetical protein